MTLKDTIRMAREANLPACHSTHPKALERFAALVAAAEREECARIAETAPDILQNSTFDGVAAAIRARGNE